jgi:amino acid permease
MNQRIFSFVHRMRKPKIAKGRKHMQTRRKKAAKKNIVVSMIIGEVIGFIVGLTLILMYLRQVHR